MGSFQLPLLQLRVALVLNCGDLRFHVIESQDKSYDKRDNDGRSTSGMKNGRTLPYILFKRIFRYFLFTKGLLHFLPYALFQPVNSTDIPDRIYTINQDLSTRCNTKIS